MILFHIIIITILVSIIINICRRNVDFFTQKYQYLIGIIVPIYNRSKIGCIVLDRLSKCFFYDKTLILLLDDGSTETKIIQKIRNIKFPNHVTVVTVFQKRNNNNSYHNIGKNLLKGFDYLIKKKCRYVMNLDDDMLVKPNFMKSILELSHKINLEKNGGFITGFLETNNLKKGNIEMYKTYYQLAKKIESKHYIIRAFGGGCNHFMTNKMYISVYRPSLYRSIKLNVKWDDFIVKNTNLLLKTGNRSGIWYSPNQGVMQHLGFVGLNSFVWDYDYVASRHDIMIFKELNIKKSHK
jgi:hypothetical protein